MSYDAILQVNNYLFLCFVLLECVVPITSNNTNLSFEMTNKNNGNSILANNKLLQNDNETQKIELTLVSSNNSSVHDVYQLDESKYQDDSWNVTGIQKSLENSFNYSSLISKDDNEKESNLRNNFNNETRNSSSLIKLTSAGDSSLFNKSTTGTLSKEITRIYNINRSNNTERFTKLLFSTKSNIKSTTVKTIHAGTSLHVSKPRHKILRHLNLVPIEDEPFGGVLWKNNSKYVMSVCIPIGVGIAGAACIIGMAYAARRCYKNERKIQEIRAALQQQISATRSDETVLLESSDDDM